MTADQRAAEASQNLALVIVGIVLANIVGAMMWLKASERREFIERIRAAGCADKDAGDVVGGEGMRVRCE